MTPIIELVKKSPLNYQAIVKLLNEHKLSTSTLNRLVNLLAGSDKVFSSNASSALCAYAYKYGLPYKIKRKLQSVQQNCRYFHSQKAANEVLNTKKTTRP